MKNAPSPNLPTVAEVLAVAKARNIPLTEKQAKVMLKRWRTDIERRAMPQSAIQGNMEIFDRYIQPGFIITSPGSKTAYSVPRSSRKR
ncbi:hypothetical protein [Klebsiella oxytoca]|uniref:hypothetical protein n=1 Tax=Klebsiella oxytoca TaxID=571 RepID=UPI00157ABC4A|nr:hypothetical protein [Klebsiella oxytoca]